MTFDLKPVLKTLLFSTSSALTAKAIQAVFTRFHQENTAEEAAEEPEDEAGESDGWRAEDVPSLVTATQIREAVDEINRELDECGEVYRVQEAHDGYRLVTRPEYAVWVRLLRDDVRRMRLSQAALETLAIVAYRQPVTRAEMESIRGVSVDGAINRLLERELVEVIGRADLPGRPIQYGTTETFLEFVGVRSLEELPASDVLSQRQIDDWLRQAAEGRHPGDSDVGLPEENVNGNGTEASVSAEAVADESYGREEASPEEPGDPDPDETAPEEAAGPASEAEPAAGDEEIEERKRETDSTETRN